MTKYRKIERLSGIEYYETDLKIRERSIYFRVIHTNSTFRHIEYGVLHLDKMTDFKDCIYHEIPSADNSRGVNLLLNKAYKFVSCIADNLNI
jgi:hypothetical protein